MPTDAVAIRVSVRRHDARRIPEVPFGRQTSVQASFVDVLAPWESTEYLGRNLCLTKIHDTELDTVAASIADGEQRTWKQTAAFKDLVYWKHDDPPMDADPLRQAVQWAEIAGVLHGETNPEEAADGGDLNRGPSAEL